jgi:hypothetical protein
VLDALSKASGERPEHRVADSLGRIIMLADKAQSSGNCELAQLYIDLLYRLLE